MRSTAGPGGTPRRRHDPYLTPATRGHLRPERHTSPTGLWLSVLLTSIGVGVYFPLRYLGGSSLETLSRGGTGLASTYADRPLLIQVAFYCHIVFAGLSLLIGGFQFSRRLRRRACPVHRWIGRVYVTAVLTGAVAAFIMSFASSAAFSGFFGFGSLAVLWFWTTYRGYTAIRGGSVAEHQAWMIRSFALTYAAVTLRLWVLALVCIQLLFGAHGDLAATAYAPLPFLAWLPNLIIAERLIRRRNLPGLRLVADPTQRPRQRRRSATDTSTAHPVEPAPPKSDTGIHRPSREGALDR